MTTSMWGLVLVLSIMPLVAHEIVVLAKKVKKD
jgi:Ca2+-transporting ATPase